MAGYAACLQVLSALPPRPNRPDKWGRFGLGAILNAGKNGGNFQGRGNGLAANLSRFPIGGVKIRFPLSRKGLADHDARLRRPFFAGLAKSGSVIFS